MPTYEYECPKCGIFDVFQSMKDAHLQKCPTCRSRKIKRLMGRGAGIIFKGSGFYQTDYRSTGYHTDAKADTAGKTPAPADTATTADSKPSASSVPAPAASAATATADAKPAAAPAASSAKADKKKPSK
jgi:putative FmdB family regulatory protein